MSDKITLEIELGESCKQFLQEMFAANNNSQLAIKLDKMNHKLDKLIRINKELKIMNAETKKLLEDLDAATTEVATDIQVLIDKANEAGSVSAAEINAALAPKVEFLRQLGADTNAPLPPVPPPTEPTPVP